MGGIHLTDETKKDLNRIRKYVPLNRIKGRRGPSLTYSDIIGFIARFYKKAKK